MNQFLIIKSHRTTNRTPQSDSKVHGGQWQRVPGEKAYNFFNGLKTLLLLGYSNLLFLSVSINTSTSTTIIEFCCEYDRGIL